MKPNILIILIFPLIMSGCASMEKSMILGAGVGGAFGGGVGNLASQNVEGTLLGLGIGAIVGGAIGYLGHTDKEEKERLTKLGIKKEKEPKAPSLTSPEVRRVWVPERIDGDKFVEGHYMYVIEHNSVWSK